LCRGLAHRIGVMGRSRSNGLAAEEAERRVLVDELIESITVCPDHLEAIVCGAPPLNVTLEEIGLKSRTVGVGGATPTIPDWRIRPWPR